MEIHAKRWNRHLKSLDTFHQIVWNNHFKPYIIHGDSCKKMESASEISRYISSNCVE